MANSIPLTLKSQENQERAFVFTKVSRANGKPLTKEYSYTSGELIKGAQAPLKSGKWQVVEVADARAFADMLTMATPDSFHAYGVPKLYADDQLTEGRLFSKRVYSKLASVDDIAYGDILRTGDHWQWLAAPAIMMVDYDPQPERPIYSRDEFFAALCKAIPQLAEAPVVLSDSTSSWIYHKETGELLKGEGGKRAYIFVDKGTAIERIAEVLKKRLWLNGEGFFIKSANGRELEKTLIDTVVYQPARQDYLAAHCVGQVEQRRPAPTVINNDKPALVTANIRNLAAKQLHRFEESRGRELAKSKLNNTSEAPHVAGEGINILAKEFLITLNSGNTIPAHDLAKAQWKGEYIRDPLEPDYDGSRDSIAYVIHKPHGEVLIFSHAHGGSHYVIQTDAHSLHLKARLKVALTKNPWATTEGAFCYDELAAEVREKVQQTREYTPDTAFGGVVMSAMRHGSADLPMTNPKEMVEFLNSLPVDHAASRYWQRLKVNSAYLFAFPYLFFRMLDKVHDQGSFFNADPDTIRVTEQRPTFMTNKESK